MLTSVQLGQDQEVRNADTARTRAGSAHSPSSEARRPRPSSRSATRRPRSSRRTRPCRRSRTRRPESGQQLTAGPGNVDGRRSRSSSSTSGSGAIRAGAAASGFRRANKQEYTAQAGDVANTLRVRVTAKNSSGSTQATSAATSAVAPGTARARTRVDDPGHRGDAAGAARGVAGAVQPESDHDLDDVARRPRAASRTRAASSSAALSSSSAPTPLVASGGEVETGADGWATVTLRPR